MEKKENVGAKTETKPKVAKTAAESVYGVKELAANAEAVFGTRSECVIAAFKDAGKTQATKAEAQKIIEKFLKKEVR